MAILADEDSSARPAGIRASTQYSPVLESLRGWAILLVFLFHADSAVLSADRMGTIVSPLHAFVTAGHTGVTLFFVLSAFLLSRPFLEQGLGGRPVVLSNFFRRRILRIMPLYASVVVTAVVLCSGVPGALLDGLRALFFVNSFTGEPATLHPYGAVWWSLATEAQFYLFLPALGFCLASRKGRLIGLVALLAWAAAYTGVLAHVIDLSLDTRLALAISLPGRPPAFLAGIFAAWVVLRRGDRIRALAERSAFWRNGGSDLVLISVLWTLGLVLRAVTRMGFFPAENNWHVWHLAESVSWTLVVLIASLAPLRVRALVSNRALAGIGVLSYSLYLVHGPVLSFFLRPMQATLREDTTLWAGATVVGFAACLALSAATYRWIERPFLVRKARIDR